MPNFLHIHPLRTDTSQNWYRDVYRLSKVDYELSRNVNNKGETVSDLKGGRIVATLEEFGDSNLFHWLFRPDILEQGEVVTTDLQERVIEKFHFARAKLAGYRLHFDANTKNAIFAVLTIDAAEISTDNNLFFETK